MATLIIGKERFEGMDLRRAFAEVKSVLRWRHFDRFVVACMDEPIGPLLSPSRKQNKTDRVRTKQNQ